jgi:hypothetical protein
VNPASLRERSALATRSEVAKAAIECGPDDICRLLLADEPSRREEYWHYTARNRLINGLVAHLRDVTSLTLETKLTCWCLAVGFCRWFDESDIRHLSKLRKALRDSCTEESERQALTDALHRLTPSEAVREPPPEREAPILSTTFAEPKNTLAMSLEHIYRGGEVDARTALDLVRAILRERSEESVTLIPLILKAVGSGRGYASTWFWDDRAARSSLLEIGSLVCETTCGL